MAYTENRHEAPEWAQNPCRGGSRLRLTAMLRALVVLIGAVSVPISGGAVQTAVAGEVSSAKTRPYGVIEIGSKGLKAYVFDLDHAETDPGCAKEDDAYLKCLNARILPQANINASDEQSIGRIGPAIKDYYNNLTRDFHIEPGRVYIVGSSGLPVNRHNEIQSAVTEAVQPKNSVEFISVDQEAEYGFDGILGMLPYKSRLKRQSQATVIDIGSGNLKASYFTKEGISAKIVTFGVNYGTKTATDEIDQTRGALDFPQAADKWRTAVFAPELRRAIGNYPGVSTKNRVYLIGGITWAMVTMTHPDDATKFVPIQVKNISDFLDATERPDATATLCSNERKARNSDITKICDNIFTPNNLISGTEILKGLSEELGFEKNKRALFFFRDALYAWPLGYLKERVYSAGRS